MGDTRALAMAGVTVGGVRYMYLSGDDQVIRARKKTLGLHMMKTVQAVIIAVYEPTVPGLLQPGDVCLSAPSYLFSSSSYWRRDGQEAPHGGHQ